MKFIIYSLTVLLLLTAFAEKSSAHNYHTSLTRIDFNKAEKSLEIEINLFNHDLERVIEVKTKKRFDLEKSKEIDKYLLEYLNETFVIKDARDSVKKLVWVGKEMNTDMTTFFLEIDNIENFEGLKLQNKIFFESFVEQVNLVTFYSEGKKSDFMFKVGDSFKNLVLDSQNKEVSFRGQKLTS